MFSKLAVRNGFMGLTVSSPPPLVSSAVMEGILDVVNKSFSKGLNACVGVPASAVPHILSASCLTSPGALFAKKSSSKSGWL